MRALTQCQREIRELPAAALRDWHRAPSTGGLCPRCHAAHPSPTTGSRAQRHPPVQQPGVIPTALGTCRFPHQKGVMAGLASAGTPAPAPCPAGRQHARPPTGSPQDVLWRHGDWVRVPTVLPRSHAGQGGRGGMSAPKLALCGEGQGRCQAGGDRPQMLLCFRCAPHTWDQVPGLGQSCLWGSPSVVPAGSWGFICGEAGGLLPPPRCH